MRGAGKGAYNPDALNNLRARQWYVRSADGRRGGCEPTLGPLRDRSQHRLQCAAARRQSIAHADWRSGVHEPLHDALGLELTKSFGENSITYSWDTGEQLIEARRPWEQGLDDRPGPAFSNQLDCALKGRAVVEAPTDHGERFYSLSLVSETTRLPNFKEIFLAATADGDVPAVGGLPRLDSRMAVVASGPAHKAVRRGNS